MTRDEVGRGFIRWAAVCTLFAASLMGVSFAVAAPASASVTPYCSNVTLAEFSGCSGSYRTMEAELAWGDQHSVCVYNMTNTERHCSGGPGEAAFIQFSCTNGFPNVVNNSSGGKTTVHGESYDCSLSENPKELHGWQGDNLGGETTSDPAVSSWAPGRLDVFARGVDNHLWHKYWTGSSWSGWEWLPSSENAVGGPDAVSWGANRIDVVARKSDGSIDHWYWNGSAWVKDNIGGSTESDPAISSWGENRLDVFIRGKDNALWHKSWNAGSGWSSWEDLGGNLVGAPSAVSWGPNRIDIVGRDSSNTLDHWWFEGTEWHSQSSLGAATYKDPAITSTGYDELDVYYAGTDNNLWQRKYSLGGGWGAFSQVGGQVSGGPDAVSWGGGRIDVVVPNYDPQHSVSHYYYLP